MNKFYSMSIKGRVAYSILCLENALIYYKVDYEKWKIPLYKLWSFTEIAYLDDWYYEMAEYIPDSILSTKEYCKNDFEYLDEQQFLYLKDLYGNCNTPVCKIFRLIFEIGTIDLYSKIDDHSPNTLDKIEEILSIMRENNIPLPTQTVDSPFEKNDGWGDNFSAKTYSSIIS